MSQGTVTCCWKSELIEGSLHALSAWQDLLCPLHLIPLPLLFLGGKLSAATIREEIALRDYAHLVLMLAFNEKYFFIHHLQMFVLDAASTSTF